MTDAAHHHSKRSADVKRVRECKRDVSQYLDILYIIRVYLLLLRQVWGVWRGEWSTMKNVCQLVSYFRQCQKMRVKNWNYCFPSIVVGSSVSCCCCCCCCVVVVVVVVRAACNLISTWVIVRWISYIICAEDTRRRYMEHTNYNLRQLVNTIGKRRPQRKRERAEGERERERGERERQLGQQFDSGKKIVT